MEPTINTEPDLVNPIKPKFPSFVNRWKALSRKRKLIYTFLVLIFILAVFLRFSKGEVGEKISRVAKGPLTPSELGDWQKLVIPQREPPAFTLKTVEERKFGILPDERLVLTSKFATSEGFIESIIDSNIPVDVSSVSESAFEIAILRESITFCANPSKENIKDKLRRQIFFFKTVNCIC